MMVYSICHCFTVLLMSMANELIYTQAIFRQGVASTQQKHKAKNNYAKVGANT